MTKRYTLFHLILPLALFVIPKLLFANGDPMGGPGVPPADSIAQKLGHCNPITFVEVDCVTKTITLSAYVRWTFTGVLDPMVATWSTGQTAHKIVVVPPGDWSWDPSATGCEESHWDNEYSQPGSFFNGTINVLAPPLCPGEFINLDLEIEPAYDFPNYSWNPPNPTGDLVPYEVTSTGTYAVTVVDDLGCPFTDVVNVVMSPGVNPTLSGPPFMCSEGDTATVQLNQMWNSYNWGTGDTINPITVYGPGVYDVTVTNQYGCTGVGFFGVQNADIDPFPISITAPLICVGDKDTLRVVGGFSQYHWSNNVNTLTNIVTTPGTYTVTVTNSYGCTGTGSVTVGLKPTPTIAITSTPMCPGGTSTLTVTGGSFPNYLWSGGQTTSAITVNAPGTYSVTVSGTTICPANNSVTVVQMPAPTTVISPPAQLNCVTNQTTLNATASSSGPEFSLAWTTVGGHFVSGQSSLSPVVDSAGTYVLTITNTTTGCTSSTSVPVTANYQAPPAPTGTPAVLNCTVLDLNIGPITPPADPTLIPVWTTSNGNIVSGDSTWNPNVNQPGVYSLLVTNPLNGCTSSASVQVNQNTALPNAAIDQPTQITCTASTVALNGNGSSVGGNFTYLWTTSNGGTINGPTNGINAVAASIGTYTLLVTNNINNCTAEASVIVTADQNIPVVGAQPADTLSCKVFDITIDATASSSGQGYTYTWTGPNPTSIIGGQGTLTPTVNAPGTYLLLLVNTNNNCFANLSVVVPQDILPPVSNAGQDETLNCVTPSLNLDGTASSTGANYVYQWTTTNGSITNGDQTLTPTVGMPGLYQLQVTNLTNGCTALSTVQVLNDANAPIAAIAQPATLTCVTLQTIIDATASSTGSNFNYTWSGPGIVNGQGSLQLEIDEPGVYQLDIVNTDNGCTDTESITVSEDVATPTALAGNDGLINCTTPIGAIGSTNNPTGSNFTFQWTTVGGSFTSPTNGPTATIDGAGTYTLLVVNTQNGCSDTDDVIVLADFAAPTVEAGPTFELDCVATSTVLQGSGSSGPGITYLWTTTNGNIVSGENTLTPTVDEEGTYNLLITNTINGCKSNDQVTITQNANVPISTIATPPILTCILTSLNLNAAGSSTGATISYTWTASNGGNISSGNTTLTPTIDAPGTYKLNVYNSANDCGSNATIVVQENIQDPIVDAGTANTLTCTVLNSPLQASIVSSSSPNISYQWSTNQSGNPITVSAPGTYTVTVTDAINGCTGTDQVTVSSNTTLPVANIAQPATLTCLLEQTNLDATTSSGGPGFTYSWTTTDGNIVSGINTNEPLVDDPGTYNLVVTNTQNGCTQTASIDVPEDVNKPTAEAGPTVDLDCDTPSNQLNGDGSSEGSNFIYLWSTTNGQIISGNNTLTPQIGDPGIYVLTVTNLDNGCTSFDNVTVEEDLNKPVFAIAPPGVLTCVTLSTQLVGSGSSFGNSPTFTWATNNGNIVSGGNTLTAVVNDPGTYTLTIVNNQNGCTDVHQVTVTEDVTPLPVLTQPVLPLTCSVLQRNLQANAPAQAILQWSTQNGNIVSGANTPTPLVDEPGLYLVIATTPTNGCTSSAQVTLGVELNIPTGLDFTLSPPLCNGVLGQVVVEQIDGGIGPFEYSIDGGQSFFPAQDIEDLVPGQYELVIRDVNGCTVTETIPVPAPPTPDVTLPPSFDIQIGQNQELQAVVPSSFPTDLINEVIWEPTTGLTFAGTSVSQLLNPTAMPFVTTEYKVTIVTKEGCKAESRTIIRVDRKIDIYPPNIIWPEEPEGVNNAFTLFAREGSVIDILQLHVYDRWGEEMFVNRNFQPNDPSIGWNGDYKGQPVNPGVFVWWAEVQLIDGQVVLLKGDVTVVR